MVKFYAITFLKQAKMKLWLAHCLRSLSSLRCGVEKSLRTTNETIFLAHINLSVGSACQNALCSANNATKAETVAVRRLRLFKNMLLTKSSKPIICHNS